MACFLSSCTAFIATRHSYTGGSGGATVNGAHVRMEVRPEGGEGTVAVSAMVVSGAFGTVDGPFSWRVLAEGQPGVQEALVIHRIRTTTQRSKRQEWYPAEKLGRQAVFTSGKDGRARARYPIPGKLKVMPREDGALAIDVDLSVKSQGGWQRRMVRFRLDPEQRKQRDVVFLPAEIVRGIGQDEEDWADWGWDR